MTHKTQELITDLDYGFEMSNAKEKDPLLREEDIETFFLIPNQRVNLASRCLCVASVPRAVQVSRSIVVPSRPPQLPEPRYRRRRRRDPLTCQ